MCTHIKCPICESLEVIDVIPRVNDHITGDIFQILGCKSCGVCFTYPVPDNMELYYPSEYRGYGALAKAVLRTFYRFRVRRWMKMIGKPGMVLEIGCGEGLMLDTLRQKGWKVMGIERTEAMAVYARDTLGLDIVSGGIELVPGEKNFDLIILFQVLEHMHNPQSILKECAARLKPGGFLIINVPNFDSWQARFGGNVWLHLDPPRHLFHFSPKSLTQILRTIGLDIHDVKFISFEHDTFVWIQTAINKIIGHYNVLTRYLMGIEKLNFYVVISVVLGLLMVIPSIFLSVVSWVMSKGALTQVVAVAPMISNNSNR